MDQAKSQRFYLRRESRHSSMIKASVSANLSRFLADYHHDDFIVHFAATREALSLYFCRCGVVDNVTITTDTVTSKPKGSAYVTFESKESVDKTLAMSGTTFFCRILKKKKKGDTSCKVSFVVDTIFDFLSSQNIEEKDKVECGALICGVDNSGTHVDYVLRGRGITSKSMDCSPSAEGSGGHFACHMLNKCYKRNMNDDKAMNLGFKALYMGTMFHRSSGGPLRVFHIDVNGIKKEQMMDSLTAYVKLYNVLNETSTLLMITDAKKQRVKNYMFHAKDFEHHFRFIFESKEEATKAYESGSHHGLRSPYLDLFPRKFELSKNMTKFISYMSQSSKQLVETLLHSCEVAYNM